MRFEFTEEVTYSKGVARFPEFWVVKMTAVTDLSNGKRKKVYTNSNRAGTLEELEDTKRRMYDEARAAAKQFSETYTTEIWTF